MRTEGERRDHGSRVVLEPGWSSPSPPPPPPPFFFFFLPWVMNRIWVGRHRRRGRASLAGCGMLVSSLYHFTSSFPPPSPPFPFSFLPGWRVWGGMLAGRQYGRSARDWLAWGAVPPFFLFVGGAGKLVAGPGRELHEGQFSLFFPSPSFFFFFFFFFFSLQAPVPARQADTENIRKTSPGVCPGAPPPPSPPPPPLLADRTRLRARAKHYTSTPDRAPRQTSSPPPSPLPLSFFFLPLLYGNSPTCRNPPPQAKPPAPAYDVFFFSPSSLSPPFLFFY